MQRFYSSRRGWLPARLVAGVLVAGPVWAIDSTGLIPIPDMQPGETYEGRPAGLYPDELNHLVGRPLAERLHAAQRIRPRAADGSLNPDGRIVLLSVGMSNTSQESNAFNQLLNQFANRNPALRFVNGAQGGQTAAIISNPGANFWTVIEQRLAAAGVTAQQVQAVWFKEANAQPSGPVNPVIDTLREQFESILQIMRSRYPNLQIVYSSSRTYGGYATTALNPEPYAYAGGFAVQDLVADQIRGDDPGLTTGDSGLTPYAQWGAYLWADGLAGREDGLVWIRDDFQKDGTHPSAAGQAKVADLLLAHFSADWTARLWFLRPQLQTLVGDLNGDRVVSVSDVGPFVLALTDPAAYALAFPGIDASDIGDLNADGALTVADIGPFVALLTNY